MECEKSADSSALHKEGDNTSKDTLLIVKGKKNTTKPNLVAV